jgi:ElaB/YqjD/DUF883 family membrane-anchored ribosome-binding protein
MENEPEMIREQMDATRSDMTKKLELLEQTVVDTTTKVTELVHNVQEGVEDTVKAVKGTVDETVKDVRDAFNVARQVRRHPWLMVGGALAAGYVTGTLLRPALWAAGPDLHFNGAVRHAGERFGPTEAAPLMGTPLNPAPAPPGPPQPSLVSSVMDTFAPEIDKLKGLAIGALMGTLREMVTRELPPQYSGQVTDMVNSITTKLGGTVT